MTAPSLNECRAERVFHFLDPDAADFGVSFRVTDETTRDVIAKLARETRDPAEWLLWQQVYECLGLTRQGKPGHIESARSCLRVLRKLRDYARMDRALTQQAVELSRLRRRLLELCARPEEPVPGLEEVRGG